MNTVIETSDSARTASGQTIEGRIGFGEKLGYGVGDLASNLVFAAMTTFLTYFYTDVAGIAAATVGTIILISRVLDGFADIGMGIIIDKTKSKHGKTRPWILWMSVPFSISGVLLFTMPDFGMTGKIIWIIVTYNLVNILYTAINVPYGALNSLITQDQYQRSLLNIFRMMMAMVGAVLVSVITTPIVEALGDGPRGWQMTFGIYGVIAAILFYVTFRSTKERVKPVAQHSTPIDVPVKVGVKALFRNKYWAIMVVVMTLMFIIQGTSGANIYYAEYVLGNKDLVGTLTMTSFLPLLLGMVVLAPVVKNLGKRNAMLIGIVIGIVGSFIMMINPESLTIVIAGSVIKGFGMAPIAASGFAMLADTIEYGEWKSGVRTEGLVYSAGSFGTKVGSGLGAGVLGWALALGGYVGGQTAQSAAALSSIKALYIYIPLLLFALQFVLLLYYKLDKEYPGIIRDLQERAQKKS